MKKLMIAGVSALSLLTACGVDKEGTADKLVEDIEARDGVTLSSDQKDCVKQVITGMSEDEITAISEGTASADASAEFGSSVTSCISIPVEDEGAAEEAAADESAADDAVDEG